MEKELTSESTRGMQFWVPLLVTLVSVFAVLIAYGPEHLGTAMHDTFHDFRHSIGFPCH
ncbi:MAG: CbtB domain-containing protein [Nitrospinota bacterium]